MKRGYQFLFTVMLMSLFLCFDVHPDERDKKHPDKVLKQGCWELRIFYRNKGTRSEGQHGILLHQDKPIEGRVVGDEKDTDLGRMEYYGPEDKKKVPWAPTGWNFADKESIKPSWQDQNEEGNLE